MTTSVIIVTLDRPGCVRSCLRALIDQVPRPNQIIVVDASRNESTWKVVRGFEGVLYLRNCDGAGRMTGSRNLGLKHATGDVIAFIDDDAYPRPNWLSELLGVFTSGVEVVGGRALRDLPDEENSGVHEIGRLKPDGVLTGFFGADPGRVIEVDHIIGCNMAYARTLLAELGGLREDYKGTEVREETDICIRARLLGRKIMFNPKAVVDHIGAPQAVGERFDVRYDYYAQRNHLILLIRNFGIRSRLPWRYLGWSGQTLISDAQVRLRGHRPVAAACRFAAGAAGIVTGSLEGVRLLWSLGTDPVRRDPEGQELAAALARKGEPWGAGIAG